MPHGREALGRVLSETAAPFGIAVREPDEAEMRYALLYGELAGGDADDDYAMAMALEFVYEGYLLHYRESRVLAGETPLETRLLAGDHFDARGLHEVARRGDVESAGLLTRLMSACSWLRSEGLPFESDDDLWALAVAGIASVRGGGNAIAALNGFDGVDRLIARDRAARVPELARRAAAAVPLRDPRPLRAALGLLAPDESGSRESGPETEEDPA
jgi:hypothetical protein